MSEVQTFASSELSLSVSAVIRLQLRQSKTQTQKKTLTHVVFLCYCVVQSKQKVLLEVGSPVRAGGRRSVDGFLTAS